MCPGRHPLGAGSQSRIWSDGGLGQSRVKGHLDWKEEIDKIEKKMTPEQIAQAKDLAKSWKPQN